MTTNTQAQATSIRATAGVRRGTGEMMAIAFAAMLGIAMIVVVGHVQASTLHDAAHDVRHATGFPCH